MKIGPFRFGSSSQRKIKPPFQLEFAGLKVKSGFFHNLNLFSKAVLSYLRAKVSMLGKLCIGAFKLVLVAGRSFKRFFTRKLLWSRGQLGRPIANLAILSVAFVAFLIGGVFSGNEFVNSASISPDYIKSSDDIISQVPVTTTALPEGRRTEAITHEVRPGETLSSIGRLYKISTDALKYVNSVGDNDILSVGQKLTVPPIQGVFYKVKSGDTCDSIGKQFEVASQAILDFNYIDSCSLLAVGKELVIPDAKIPAPQIAAPIVPQVVAPSYSKFVDANPKSGWCIWPTSARIITQNFSFYHNGLDIATPWGTMPPIYACGNGTVTRSGWDPFGLGLHIVIDHGNGYQTVYGHMSKLNVGVGRDVDKGDVIGVMGNTGRSTGPHVHFIVKYNGVPQNPLKYVR